MLQTPAERSRQFASLWLRSLVHTQFGRDVKTIKAVNARPSSSAAEIGVKEW